MIFDDLHHLQMIFDDLHHLWMIYDDLPFNHGDFL